MLHWREKFVDKLSRLLADSPSSSPRATPSSPVVRSEPVVPSLSKEEPCHSESLQSFSLLFDSLISAATNGHDGHKSNLQDGERDSPSSSHHLFPSRWRKNYFSWRDRPVAPEEEFGAENGCYEGSESNEEDEHISDGNLDSSRKFAETSTSPILPKFPADLTSESSFVSPDLYEFLQSCIPNIVKWCQWALLYRAVQRNMVYHFGRFSGRVLISLDLIC